MTPFALHVSENMHRHGLIARDGACVIVALSGGADSVALLHSLREGGFPLVAAHCNFGLRGAESDGDEAFVTDLCRRLGVRLFTLHPDVAGYMRDRGVSVEMACRDLRYEWFARLLHELDADAVAVAHHRDDNVETFFLNMLRGSGITGLRGMQWRREPSVIRPMLDVTRSAIERYLTEIGESWRTDSTNAVSDVMRNRLRNIVLPVLRGQFDGADARISATIANLAENESLYRSLLSRRRADYALPDGSLDVAALSADPHGGLLLWEWLRDSGLTRAMADDIIAAPMRSGLRFGSWLLDRGVLSRHEEAAERAPVTVTPESGPWTMETITPEEFRPVRDARVAYFDISILDGDARWCVRPWRKGDRVRPFGMTHGSRLVSDLFSDRHLSLTDKERVSIVTRDDVIVWIPGLLTTAHFPVTGASEAVVRLTYRSGQ